MITEDARYGFRVGKICPPCLNSPVVRNSVFIRSLSSVNPVHWYLRSEPDLIVHSGRAQAFAVPFSIRAKSLPVALHYWVATDFDLIYGLIKSMPLLVQTGRVPGHSILRCLGSGFVEFLGGIRTSFTEMLQVSVFFA